MYKNLTTQYLGNSLRKKGPEVCVTALIQINETRGSVA